MVAYACVLVARYDAVVDTPDKRTLRELARLLAPYLREVLEEDEGENGVEPRRPRLLQGEADYNDEAADVFVQNLSRDVTEHAIVFFDALRKPPHRIDANTLADQLGAISGRALPGMLTTPLKRHADRVGFARPPWDEPKRTGREPTIWRDRDGNAERIYNALLRHRDAHPHWTPGVHDLLAQAETRRPAPVSVYVWAPEYADPYTDPKRDGSVGGSSCLRTDGPGTRAAIYRSQVEQGIVALFDVGERPEEDPEWGWYAEGRFHVLPEPVTRAELLELPELERVFRPIMGRRRIPAAAQLALQQLLASKFENGLLPVLLPLEESDPVPKRSTTHSRRRGR